MLNELLMVSGLKRRWPILDENEIRRHNTRHSLWIVSGHSVYDVTGVLSIHPGGDAAILRGGGGSKNCEVDFSFHSRYARREWAERKIGEITPDAALRLFPFRDPVLDGKTRCAAGQEARLSAAATGSSHTHEGRYEESCTCTVDAYPSSSLTPDQPCRKFVGCSSNHGGYPY